MLPELLTWKLFVKYLKDKSSSKKKQNSVSVWGMIFFHYEKHDTETRQTAFVHLNIPQFY